MAMCFAIAINAQVTGTVVDTDGTPLIGATVMFPGTSTGTLTDADGKFTLNGSGDMIEVSYLGYNTIKMDVGNGNLGTIRLISSATELGEVTIVGVVDIAQDRKTPVAVSTIGSREIIERLGNQELPEILKYTPSIYATKQGGGFGDSRINVRGFTQENTAVLINGVPVNDMENGRVFWSNWTGLADVASAMQVQRGLGSSKIAISSVGGTVNIVTKVTDLESGGNVGATVGNDGYIKTTASYSSGRMDNGFATSVLLGRTSGNGYATGTSFTGYNFFLGLGWSDDAAKNNVQFVVTGAPQVHNQRTTSFFNMATLGDYNEYGNQYNYNHGELNGEEFNWRRNFYHKPVASLNWDSKLTSKMTLNSVFYASAGRGGGTGDIGRLPGFNFASSSIYRGAGGEVLWDDIVRYNEGQAVTFQDGEERQREAENGMFINTSRDNGLTRRASINSHNWIGTIINLNTKLNDRLTFDVGLDLRKYKGIHYRRLDNLLGADAYMDNDDINNPDRILTTTYESGFESIVNVFKSIDDEEKIDYYNDGLVRWTGAFGQLEYSEGAVTAFVQGAVSNQGFKRVDYFNYLDSDPIQTTDWVNILGGNIKGGLNYNLTDNHNVFVNGGYYSKQPNFDAVFLDFLNNVNEDLVNEDIIGLEAGYGYRSSALNFNINLYRTSWANRFFQESVELEGGEEGTGTFRGLTEIHSGIEFDGRYKINDKIGLTGMLSINNWIYDGNVEADIFSDDQTKVGSYTLFVDKIPVGDAAQTTARLGIDVRPVSGLSFNVDWYHANNLYADFLFRSGDFAEDFGTEAGEVLKLPAYSLFDLGAGYRFLLGDNKSNALSFRININNVLDTEYLSESKTNILESDDPAENWNGVNTRNKVFFGFGRTWNASVRYSF